MSAAILIAAAPVGGIDPGIRASMDESAAGWNAGDLGRFMGVYADAATYVTAKGLVRGKAAIAERYRASFADGANRRGTLSFRFLGHRTIDRRHELVFARWTLTPAVPAKVETGMTTLLSERQAAGWRIVADHSS